MFNEESIPCKQILSKFLRNCKDFGLVFNAMSGLDLSRDFGLTSLDPSSPFQKNEANNIIDKENSMSRGTKIIASVSGGSDSVGLLVLLSKYFDVTAISINHNMRPESYEEVGFVKELCCKLQIKFIEASLDPIDLQIGNFQNNARNARYKILTRYALSNNIGLIATGHHLDDLAESFFLKVLRGSSVLSENKVLMLDGVKVIRPLFNIRKSSIQEFLIANKIKWMEDSSNTSLKYKRNRIRFGLDAFYSFVDRSQFQNGLLTTINNLTSLREIAMKYINKYEPKYSQYGYIVIENCFDIDRDCLFYVLQQTFAKIESSEIRASQIESAINLLIIEKKTSRITLANLSVRVIEGQLIIYKFNNKTKAHITTYTTIGKYSDIDDTSKAIIDTRLILGKKYNDIYEARLKPVSGIDCRIKEQQMSYFLSQLKGVTVDFLSKDDYILLNRDIYFRKQVNAFKKRVKDDLTNLAGISSYDNIPNELFFGVPIIRISHYAIQTKHENVVTGKDISFCCHGISNMSSEKFEPGAKETQVIFDDNEMITCNAAEDILDSKIDNKEVNKKLEAYVIPHIDYNNCSNLYLRNIYFKIAYNI